MADGEIRITRGFLEQVRDKWRSTTGEPMLENQLAACALNERDAHGETRKTLADVLEIAEDAATDPALRMRSTRDRACATA